MGCFFGCFRTKDSHPNLVTPSKEPVAPLSKNALSSLFLTDDEPSGMGVGAPNHLSGELDVTGLKNEAKFLKACGTLPETPVKVQKTLDKWEGISAPLETKKSLECNSWLQTVSVDESPMPAKTCEEWVTISSSFLDSPTSCMTDGHDSKRASSSSMQRSFENVDTPKVLCDSEASSEISSVSTQVNATGVQCKKKSVRFNHLQENSALSSKDSSSDCVSPHLKQSGSAGMESVTKSSPYPTAIKLNMEMQTPGTVSPALDHSVRNEMKNEESLSSWLKPISANQDNKNKRLSFNYNENVRPKRTPADRPILGMVAAHWNDEETSHVPRKWWDGKGIPNSTNKYKEDQKVSWHATPFEERLEKALSEETLLSQRKPINRTPPFELNETEESDTALSHLQSSPYLKSVVSF